MPLVRDLLILPGSPTGDRLYHLAKKCDVDQQHEHKHAHTTWCLAGAMLVYTVAADGTETLAATLGQFGQYVVPAGVKHKIKADADDTYYACVFSHKDFGGVVIEAYMGNKRAYF